MDNTKFDKYVANRYNQQISWYSACGSKNKKWYQTFQWGVIVLSATVPVLVASVPEKHQWFTVGVSILLAIGTASLKTFKFQENWFNYRSVSETLKKEKHFYDARLNDYKESEDAEALFVKRVESIISSENSLWLMTHKQKVKETKGKREY